MFLFILLFFSLSSIAAPNNNIMDVDFLDSMTDGNKIAIGYLKKNPVNYEFMKNVYETKKPSKMPYLDKPLIPKVMHHVWDGDLPPLYQNYLEECKKIHPDWEFKFWSDKDIRKLKLEYQDLYDKSRNYAGRSDIARYEILYRFGGVYRDLDVKCYRPIDDLNHMYDFFAPIEFPTKYWQATLNNGIIGAMPKHPILKSTLDTIRKNIDIYWNKFDDGEEKDIGAISLMVSKVSMMPLTEGFINQYSATDKSGALPASYFWGLSKIKYYTLWSSLKYTILGNNFNVPSLFKKLRPETLMHHNFPKEEIYTTSFDHASGMHNYQVNRLRKSLNKSDDRMFKSFALIYKENAPSVMRWSKHSKIPEVVHFIVLNEEELSILKNNLKEWKILNAAFEFRIWDKSQIIKIFDDLDLKIPQTLQENFRFYIALRILQQFGGTYANYRVNPIRPIFELNNKYNFYAGLMPFTKLKSQLTLSKRLVGSSPNHIILDKTLAQIHPKNLVSVEKIDEIFIRQTYKNIYLYDEIGGKNIVFPAGYFEPFAKLEKENSLDKLYRLFFNEPQPFSRLTDFAVIE